MSELPTAEGAEKRQSAARVIAITNQKGGVGKTTTAINLTTAVAAAGYRVLLIDLDPQANSTSGLGVRMAGDQPTSYDLIMDRAGREVLRNTVVPGLTIVPSSPNLTRAEAELVERSDGIGILSPAIAKVSQGFDYVFIDCAPALGRLTTNALLAADGVLVPMQCEFFALEGLSQLTKTLADLRSRHKAKAEIVGIVLTMFNPYSVYTGQVANDIRRQYGDAIFITEIARSDRLSESASWGLPVLLHRPGTPGAESYIDMAGEFLAREESRRRDRAPRINSSAFAEHASNLAAGIREELGRWLADGSVAMPATPPESEETPARPLQVEASRARVDGGTVVRDSQPSRRRSGGRLRRGLNKTILVLSCSTGLVLLVAVTLSLI